jgi:hypothetical protein
MLPGGTISGFRVMLRWMLMMMVVRRMIAVHLRHASRIILHGDAGDDLPGQARRRSATQRQRKSRGRDANEIGDGGKPSRPDADSSC